MHKEYAANIATEFASHTETIPVMLILPDDLDCEHNYQRVQFANLNWVPDPTFDDEDKAWLHDKPVGKEFGASTDE